MQAVLISINPKWCVPIASGIKTVEVRKTKPKLKTPFKVLIYATKQIQELMNICEDITLLDLIFKILRKELKNG